MVTFELEGIEIALRAGLPPAELHEALEKAPKGEPSKRRCPRCGKRLREFPLRSPSGKEVLLDRCPRGHGIWFDKGEIYRAVTLFAGEEGSPGSVAGFFSELLKDELRHETKAKENTNG